MNPPQYQFNLGAQDPILTNSRYSIPDYSKNIEQEIEYLNKLKENFNNRQNNISNKESIWDTIDKEIYNLTDEQKDILCHDEEYVSIDRELQLMIQQELINSVKYKVENSERGKELLNKQLDNIKNKKKEFINKSNQEMNIFKQFKAAVQANPNLTYAEFIKSLNK